MIKFFLKRYAKGFGLILAAGLVSLALGNILTSMIRSADFIYLNTGFSAAKGIAFMVVIMVFFHYNGSQKEYANEIYEPYFYKRIQQKKKIKSALVNLGFIFFLIASIACIVCLVVKYPDFVDGYKYYYSLTRDHDDIIPEMETQFIEAYFLCRSLPAMAVSSIIIWIAEMKEVSKRTCRKCKCYMSKVQCGIGTSSSSESTEYQTYDKKYEVGGIYRNKDNEKVASVYSTRKEQRSRKVHGFSEHIPCKCAYCGKEDEIIEVDVVVEEWK